MSGTYWVIGGEFSSLNFHSFIPGTQEIHGPYMVRETAEAIWKERSELSRSKANYRYVITES